jgi:subtilisin family serine protease
MKVSNFLALLTLSVQSKKYIAHLNSNSKHFFILSNQAQTPTFDELNMYSVRDTVSVGDFFAYIIESDDFPMILFNSIYISNIEEDTAIFLEHNAVNSPDILQKKYEVQEAPVWNLDRIDQKGNVLNKRYFYTASSGINTDVYIVDTGIDISHPEFGGRARWGGNFVDNRNVDCNGHGTHVAGITGSKTYGVSKKSNLVAVKVLGCEGGGSYSGVLKGLEYVFNEMKKTKRPSIINMSLGGPKSQAIDTVINNLDAAGIHIIAAAGNENANSCNVSPGGNPKVVSVAATTDNNAKAYFSNWGKCVSVLAPGTNIVSTFPGNRIQNLQGTSQASPSVAGFYSLVLSENPRLNPESMRRLLNSTCSRNTITGFDKDTFNCLLYTLV